MDEAEGRSQVAEQIERQGEMLVAWAAARANAQIPFYCELPSTAVEQMFRDDFQAIAAVLDAPDLVQLRSYVEASTTQRIVAGAPATVLIAGATLLEDGVRYLIESDSDLDTVAPTEAMRRVQMVVKNMRMIVSGINLRLLTHPSEA